MAVTSYIRRSKTGFYSYRRRVPDDCRAGFGKRELLKSLKTKLHAEALTKAANINMDFERKVFAIRGQKSSKTESQEITPSAVHEAISQAREILLKAGIHPSQRPDYKATIEEIQKYEEGMELLTDNHMDYMVVDRDPQTWQPIYREESPADPLVQAYQIATDGTPLEGEPTLEMASSYYLDWSQEDKQHSAFDQRKFEQAQRRATDRLALFLGSGSKTRGYKTRLEEMTRPLMRRYWKHLEEQNPTWSNATFNKEVGRLRACFLKAVSYYELNLANPFVELQKKQNKRERVEKRRSFSPAELGSYRTALMTKSTEVQLIGLLMIGTGCRTKEIAGLARSDVHLGSNIPYLQIRHNHIRNVKNDNSERDVPLVGRALDSLRDYLATLPKAEDPSSPLFPRYGRDGGTDAISQLLNRIIRNDLGIEDLKLVAYSTRHTMQDKLRAVETPPHIREEIMGREHESAVAKGYGQGNLLSILQRELSKAEACDLWGRNLV